MELSWRHLLSYLERIWQRITASSPHVPPIMRVLFAHIRAVATDHFGDDVSPFTSVSGFWFLRFIVPALLNPHDFGIIPRTWPWVFSSTEC